MNASRRCESNGTHHVVLFVEKSPTSCAHARSLLIGQKSANAVVLSVRLTPVNAQ